MSINYRRDGGGQLERVNCACSGYIYVYVYVVFMFMCIFMFMSMLRVCVLCVYVTVLRVTIMRNASVFTDNTFFLCVL